MGRCLFEAGQKFYKRVQKATGASIRAFATPKSYLVTVSGTPDSVTKTSLMLKNAIVRVVEPSFGRELFGFKKESVESISKHTGSTIAYWHIMKPIDEWVVVALCPDDASKQAVNDVLDHRPRCVGVSKDVVHWLRTDGVDGIRIDDIVRQSGAYVRIEDRVDANHIKEPVAVVLGSSGATRAAEKMIRECDTVERISVPKTFADHLIDARKTTRLSKETNALVVIERSQRVDEFDILLVGPRRSVDAAKEHIEALQSRGKTE